MDDLTIPDSVPRVGRPFKGSICPRCGALGSGLHDRWVLNDRKQRFEPYYYFAHSNHGSPNWCYIRKKEAIEILGSIELLKKFNMVDKL